MLFIDNESESKLNIDSKETLLKSDPEWVNDDIKPCASNSCSQDQRVPNKKNSICDIGNRYIIFILILEKDLT